MNEEKDGKDPEHPWKNLLVAAREGVMINETNIACFLSVAETLSFTESARRLYLTQQAVSKNVMQLENDCGLELLRRGSRSVTLTPAGERYRDLLQQMKHLYTDETNRIRMLYGTRGQLIDISCQNAVDLGAGLTRAIRRVKEESPDTGVRVNRFSPGELAERLYHSETSLILLYTRYVPDNPEYSCVELFKTGISLLVSCENPNNVEGATYLDFLLEPFVIDAFKNEDEKTTRQRAKHEASLAGLTPERILVVPNPESAYHTAAMGGGILLGTDVSRIPTEYGLTRYRTDSFDTISCVFRANAPEPVKDFVQILQKEYKGTD